MSSLTVRLRLFAMLRERAGWRERDFELAAGATVADAWRALLEVAPSLAAYGEVIRFARNGRYAAAADALDDGDEVALIPPVAGGAGGAGGERPARQSASGTPALRRLELSRGPISDDLLAELRRSVPTTADGALVLFVGQARETAGPPAPGEEEAAAQHAGEPVSGLDYEAFDELVRGVLEEISSEIEARFGVRRLAIIHRVGHVALAEPSVVIAAAAAHRAAAFDACRYAIEELKARAPIWKRERYASGGVWSGAPARQAPARQTELDAQP
jgi:MoaE-MoaD fusion protein